MKSSAFGTGDLVFYKASSLLQDTAKTSDQGHLRPSLRQRLGEGGIK